MRHVVVPWFPLDGFEGAGSLAPSGPPEAYAKSLGFVVEALRGSSAAFSA